MSSAEELRRRIAALDPERRARFEAKLRASGLSLDAPDGVRRRAHQDDRPLSFAQERILVDDVREQSVARYNECRVFVLRGPGLDAARLTASLSEILRRHEVLRSRFELTDQGPVQHIDPWAPLEVRRTDLTDLEPNAREARCRDLERDEALTRVDPTAAPLIRAHLVRLGEAEHRLIVVAHHIVCDAWSLRVLLDEAIRAYRGETLAPLQLAYADFAKWQRGILDRPRVRAQVELWRERLTQPKLPGPILPLDRARPSRPTYHGERLPFLLRAETIRGLEAVGRDAGATMFMVLLALTKAVTSRVSGESDLAFGTLNANREDPALAPLIGFFVNTLVLRTNLEGDPTFREVVDRTRKVTVEAYANQDVPFDVVMKAVQPARTRHGGPLFQVEFLYDPVGEQTLEADGLQVRSYEVYNQGAKFDLLVDMRKGVNGEVRGFFEYSRDVFEHATMARLADQLERVAAKAAQDPDLRLSALVVPTDREQAQLEAWNQTHRDRPAATAHELFERRVDLAPDLVAVIDGATRVTYGELDRRANRLARQLRTLGVRGEDRVGVWIPRSADLVVALLAVQKAGAAYLPLDPDHPDARLATYIQAAQPKLLIVSDAVPDAIAAAHQGGVLDLRAALPPGLADHRLDVSVDPAQLAYVVFTSGSTGQPKGVMISHAALCNHNLWMQDEFRLDPSDRFLHKTSIGFDVAAFELFWPLATGAALVLAAPGGHRDPAYIVELVQREQVTALYFVASMLTQVMDAEVDIEGCSTLRLLFSGAEALPKSTQARVYQRLPGIQLHNLYGPTEATIDITHWPCRPRSWEVAVPIGRALHNTRLFVLDAKLDRVPIGAPGRLFVAGDALARGYVSAPAVTAERFIPNPYADVPGDRLYDTGDVVRFRPDGALEYLGRADAQVKIRGQRIELSEIEHALRTHPDVLDAVLDVRSSPSGDKRLAAYYVAGTADPEPATLAAHLRERLPAVMVPAWFTRIEAVPRTPNGKLDRASLPAPSTTPVDRPKRAAAASPVSPAEQTLLEIWSAVLDAPELSVLDNFFEVGGDSILALQIVSRARRAGLEVPLQAVFEHQTVRGLAASLDALAAPRIVADASPDDEAQGFLPAPMAARYLRLDPGLAARFDLGVVVRVPSTVDADRLQVALQAVWRRHEALRLVAEPGTPDTPARIRIQSPSEAAPPTLTVTAPAAPGDVQWTAIVRGVRSAVDVAQGAASALALVPGVRGASHLVWRVHHLAVDAVSLHLLVDELRAAYSAAGATIPASLGREGPSLSAWARAQAKWATSPEAAACVQAWAPRHADPLSPVWTESSGSGSAVRLDAPELSESTLRLAATKRDASIETLLLAALGIGLSRTFGVETPHVMLERHGRDEGQADASRLVGWLTALVPVRLALGTVQAHDPSRALEVVRRELAALPRPLTSYGALRSFSSTEWNGSEPQVSFNYLGRVSTHEGGDFALVPDVVEDDEGPTPHRFELEVDAALVEGRLEARLWAKSLPQGPLQTLAGAWADALAALVAPSSREADPAPVVRSHPVSTTQEGLLFHALRAPDSGVFVQQLTCRLDGPLDQAAFERAWRDVIDHHELLRTTFRLGDGDLRSVQDVHRHGILELRREDWSETPASELDGRLEGWLAEDRRRGFNPGQLPLMRLALFDTAQDERYLVWTFHHVLMDGWCMPRLLEHVFAAYTASCAGVPSQLPAPVPYSRFVEWQDARDEGADERFWRAYFEGSSAPSRPPWRRPKAPELRPGRVERTLSSTATARVRAAARKARVTIATMLQGAWALVLSRLTEESEVLFGVTTAGRPAELDGAEDIIGPCMNTVPLRVPVRPGASVSSWLADAQDNLRAAAEHAHAPLPTIGRWAGLEGALVESVVVVENYPLGDVLERQVGALRIDEARAYEQTDLPLTLVVVPQQTIQSTLLFDGLNYDAEAARRLLELYEVSLTGLAAQLDGHLDDVDWSALAPRWPRELGPSALGCNLLHERFAARVAEAPEAVALTFRGEHLTYGELQARALAFSKVLRARGVQPGEPVALFTTRGFEMIVGMLAALEAGGAYLPLDPSHPSWRLAAAIEDSGVRWLLADGPLSPEIEASGVEVLRLDAAPPALDAAAQPARARDPRLPAYVMYTSGSTGRPKGVVITHENISRHLDVIPARYGFGRGDVFTVFHSYAFDFSVWEIWAALCSGSRLVIVPLEATRAPDELYALLAAEGVSVLTQTPSSFSGLMDVALDAQENLPSLSWLFLGGEPLDFSSLVPWFERYGDVSVVNVYGPTECTVAVTHRRITAHDARSDLGSRLGTALGFNELFVVDASGRPLPEGVRGEIVVAGPGVGAGYLARPRLTADRFRPDGLTGARGAHLYYTGDLGQWIDGELEYLGRRDRQVKVRGYRLELEEVEAALSSLAEVREAAVLAPGAVGSRRLVAYACPEPGQQIDPLRLRAALRTRLPSYMVPAVFVPMPALPRNASGKIDRLALPPAEDASSTRRRVGPAPRTKTERALARAFAEVLGVDDIGLDDDFFDLGGDSIRSIRVAAIAKREGVAVSLADLYSNPTVRALASCSGAPEEAASVPDAPDLDLPVGIEAAHPATRLQLGMLYHRAQSPDERLYHDVVAIDLETSYTTERLAEALEAVMQRHAVLRSSFELSTQRLLVHARVEPPLMVEPVAPGTDEDWTRALDVAFEAACEGVIAPDAAPLFRMHVLERADRRLGIVLSTHHGILDGWSIATFLTDLFGAVAAVGPQAAPKTSLDGPAAMARTEAAALARTAHADFWRALLQGAVAPRLPAGLDRHAAHNRATRDLGALGQRAIKVASDLGVPRRTLFLAAHFATLGWWTGTRDLVTGAVTHVRPETEQGDRLLGLFLNTLPLRLRSRPGSTWRELVAAVHELEGRALAHRSLPMQEILRPHGLALETCFNYVDFHVYDRITGGGDVRVHGTRSLDRTHFGLEIGVRPGAVDVSTRGLDSDVAGRVAEDFLHALEVMFADADAEVVGTFETPAASPRLLTESLLARFGRAAAACPHAPALVDGDLTVDYRTLQSRAAGLSALLVGQGVGPDEVVLVQASRPIDWCVAIWGVLGAGATYWPVDPAEPVERIEAAVEALRPVLQLVSDAQAPDLGVPRAEIGGVPADVRAPVAAADPEALAYVMLTSGTTGRPKPVGVSYRALERVTAFHLEGLELDGEARLLRFARPWVDASIPEVLAVQAAGGCAVAVPEGARVGAALTEHLAAQRITHAILPPSVWARTAPVALPDLRLAAAGGEACSAAVVDSWGPGRRFLNLYGPTEVAVDAVFYACAPGVAAPPIGRSIPGVEAYVLDEEVRALPRGAVGEIFLGGEQLARGYLAQPGLTAARFVPSPFGPPGARLYRTGDLGRFDEQGDLQWLGRTDRQVEISGNRIEPAEIEVVLESMPGVESAAVVLQPGPRPRLVAFLVAQRAEAADDTAVRAHLHARLPAALHPSELEWLEALPRTDRDKVDYAALLQRSSSTSGARVAVPVTDLAGVLAEVWSDVLDGVDVGRGEGLIALGGDSLAALEVSSRTERLLGRTVPVRWILEAEDVYALAARLSAVPEVRTSIPRATDIAEPVALSPAQERLWLLHQLDPLGFDYNVPSAVRIRGPLDKSALQSALDAVVERQDVLRTVFEARAGVPAQRVEAKLRLEVVPRRVSRSLDDDLLRSARRPFDLQRGPPARVELFELGPQEHVLLFVAHHIACDGPSMRVLVHELVSFYERARGGGALDLPPLPVRYADFAVHLRSEAAVAARARAVAAAAEALEGAETRLSLPFDQPPSPERPPRGATVVLETSPQLRGQVQAACRTQSITPFMFLAGTFGVVLARWAGREAAMLGYPVSGRGTPQLDALLGYFVDTRVLQVDATGTVEQMLGRVARGILEALTHAEVPLDDLMDALGHPRGPQAPPILQALFSYHERVALPEVADVEWQPVAVHLGTAKAALALAVQEEGEAWRLTLEYDDNRIAKSTAERLVERVAALASAMAEAPHRQVRELSRASGAETRLIGPSLEGPAVSIIDRFREVARAHPLREAVVAGEVRWTYEALAKRATQLANRLRARGVRRGRGVGIILERSVDRIVAILGALEAGGYYVPFEVRTPAARICAVADDVDIEAWVVDEAGAGSAPPGALQIEGSVSAGTAEAPTARPHPSDPAYVNFTSGTTGRPKAVVVPHGAVVRLVEGLERLGDLGIVLHHSSIEFDASTLELWAPLLTGGTVVVAPEGPFGVDELGALLRVEDVSTLWLSAGLFHRVVDDRVALLQGARHLFAGGDVLSPARVERAARALGPDGQLFNGYGPTETTTFATCAALSAEDAARGVVPIGGPLAGSSVYVLDAALDPVAPGEVGEIFVAGRGVSHGYAGAPRWTAERFLPDPFADASGARMYRTGDFGFVDVQSKLRFVGRRDAQAKIRGFRVEPREVQVFLLGCDGVQDAVVFVEEGLGGERQLAALLVLAEATTIDDVRARLKRLPLHLRPARLEAVSVLPLNPSGKVDRRTRARAQEAPSTARDGLSQIWCELLEVASAEDDHDFFDLGGHSLLAAQLVGRIRDRLDRQVRLRDVFDHSKFGALRGCVERAPSVEAVTRPQAGPARLTPGQARLWAFERLQPGTATYHVPLVLRLAGAVDVSALERAVEQLVGRHEVLACRVEVRDGVPVMSGGAGPALEFAAAADVAELEVAVRAFVESPFALEAEPPCRARLWRAGEDEHVLAIVLHHIVCDGPSLEILMKELGELYQAAKAGLPNGLAALRAQFADYAAGRRSAGKIAKREAEAYWRSALEGAEVRLDLPGGDPSASDAAREHARGLSGALAESIDRQARGLGATSFSFGLAALGVLLGRFCDSEEVVVACPITHRPNEAYEGVIGMFVDAVPIRIRLDDDPRFSELVVRTHEAISNAMEHAVVPWDDVWPDLPAPRVLFTNSGMQPRLPSLEGLRIETMVSPSPSAESDLVVVFPTPGEAEPLSFVHRVSSLDPEIAPLLLSSFVQVLASAVDDPQAQVSDLDLAGGDMEDHP